MKTNKQIKNSQEIEQHSEKRLQGRKNGKLTSTAKRILSGQYFENEKSLKAIPFLLYLAFLAFIYISSNYIIEDNTREINRLQKEQRELRFEYITLKSNLMTISRQSKLSKRLEKLGIKENKEPVKTIIIKQKNKN